LPMLLYFYQARCPAG